MGRQGLGGAGTAGRSMQRSQSRSSLSASFEALAGYFPCMNSLEEEEGETLVGVSVYISRLGESVSGGLAAGRELQAAVSLPPQLWGTVLGAREPPERARGAEEFRSLVIWRAPRAGADLGNGFPSEVGLSSAWTWSEDVGWWEAAGPCRVYSALFLFTAVSVLAFDLKNRNAQKLRKAAAKL